MKQLISGISKKTGLIFVTAVLLLGSLGYWVQTGKNSVTTTTLKIVATTEGLVTDPLSGKGYQQFQILSLLTDTLTAKNQSGEIVGLISDKWTINDNGVTYKFHISKNAIFSDGSKVKAKDIEFTFNRLLTPGNKSEISIYLSNVVSKVYSDDEENVIFKLKGPYPFFLDLISMSGFGIVKDKEIGSVFSGPFVLSESDDKNKHWSLTRRENYKLYHCCPV